MRFDPELFKGLPLDQRTEIIGNLGRKDYSPSEQVKIARLLKPRCQALAQERHDAQAKANLGIADGGNLPPSANGKTRDQLAAVVGTSAHTLKKATAVVEAAEADPERFGRLKVEMDRTGKVDRAYSELVAIRGAAAHFATALERYGIWPTTVWERDLADQTERALRAAIGDNGAARAGCFSNDPDSLYGITASIFSPALATHILNLYPLEAGSTVFDPFAGGGTRAVMCAQRGLRYVGLELRPDEAEAVRARAHANGVGDLVTVHVGDSRKACEFAEDGAADALMTSPPFYNLEQYLGGPQDLSMCQSYQDFLDGLAEVIEQTARILKRGARSFWHLGLVRDHKTGALLRLHHDVSRLHDVHGFRQVEEIVVHNINSPARQRVGTFDRGRHHLIRVHEYIAVFIR